MDSKKIISNGIEKYRNWQFKNTFWTIIALVVFFLIAKEPSFENFISRLGAFGYIGAFIAGVFFVSIFTIAPAAVLLFDVARSLNPLYVAITAGAGTVLGDYLIFKFLKESVFDELGSLFSSKMRNSISKLFSTPYFAWLIPIFGAVVIASPLPDEAGVCLLGLSKIKTWQFLILAFALNSIGIMAIIFIAISS